MQTMFKNSELVTIGLFFMGIFFSVLGFLAVRVMATISDTQKEIKEALHEFRLEIASQLEEIYERLRALELFKVEVAVRHNGNHPDDKLTDGGQ
jgi:uncharacterized membrane-anchored protein YhcB (DUF1043 family)